VTTIIYKYVHDSGCPDFRGDRIAAPDSSKTPNKYLLFAGMNSILRYKAVISTNYDFLYDKEHLVFTVSVAYLLNPKAEHIIQSP